MKFLLFVCLTIILLYFFKSKLKKTDSLGFNLFIACEGLAWLLVHSLETWFYRPFKFNQLCSWFLLLAFFYLMYRSVNKIIKNRSTPSGPANSALINSNLGQDRLLVTGVYSTIRHPMYCSLLCLTWGLFLKNIRFDTFLISIFTTLIVYRVTRKEETANLLKFGERYVQYKKRTKMFIPHVI